MKKILAKHHTRFISYIKVIHFEKNIIEDY